MAKNFKIDGSLETTGSLVTQGKEVATQEWVTNAEKTIVGDTTFNGDIILAGGEIRLTDDVYLDGSEIYYNGQYVGDFHPNAPYAYANKQWVESLVTNQVQYLGIVNSVDDITNAFYSSDSALGKAGDFVRAGSSFTIETETVHPGDIIIANNVTPSVSLANYDIIHTEDPGNYVTLDGHQIITGFKSFSSGLTSSSADHTTAVTPVGVVVTDSSAQVSTTISGNKISRVGATINTEFSYPPASGTLATQEWVKANTICSSTIDQEFFNSLY